MTESTLQQGLDQINISLFNAYTKWTTGWYTYNVGAAGLSGVSQIISLAGKYRSSEVYTGKTGYYNKLNFIYQNSALLLDDPYSPFVNGKKSPRLINIQEIQCEGGNNLVDLTSATYTYGDITIRGFSGNDTILANAGNDILYGGSGNDFLFGGNGNDTLSGDIGNDTLVGGNGNDTYIFNKGDGQNLVYDISGTDKIQLGSGITKNLMGFSKSKNDLVLTLQGSTDKLTVKDWYKSDNNKIEALEFENGIFLTNSQLERIMSGTLTPESSVTKTGTTGNDIYYINNTGDVIVENTNGGTDTVKSSTSYTLGSNIENLTLVNNFYDYSTIPGGKTDIIYGDPNSWGSSLLYKQGNNTYNLIGDCGIVACTNLLRQTGLNLTEQEVITHALNNDEIQADGGTTKQDQANILTDYGVAAHPEVASISRLVEAVRNNLGIVISVNAQVLLGQSPTVNIANHAVTVTGAAFDTTTGTLDGFYICNTTGSSSDSARFVSLDLMQRAYVNYGSYAAITDSPVKLYKDTSTATGNTLNNILDASSLYGDCTLDGGIGADTMIGSKSNTTFVVDNSGDTITAGTGINTIKSSISYSLGTKMQNLTLTANNLAGKGNELDNKILGSGSNTTFISSAGNDILSGAASNDTYILNSDTTNTKIYDTGGSDLIKFGSDILKKAIAIFKQGSNLVFDFGTQVNTSQSTILSQFVSSNTIEKFSLNDGSFLTSTDINRIVQDMSTFASSHGIQISSVADVKANTDLMNIVATSWHA